MHDFLPTAYFEGKFIPFTEANISIATHALHYGTGAFGGLRGTINPENPHQVLLFRLERHCQRLSNSAKYLHYDLPADKIEIIIKDFVSKNKPTQPFYIRPFVYTSDLGVAPRLHNIEKNFFVYGLNMGDYLSADGVICRSSPWYRQEDRRLPLRGKISGAYITSALAKTEAVDSGFDEAILMNSQGKVCEATGMNIFMVRNDKLITPGVNQDVLEGITRDSVMTIAKDLGIEVEQREIDKTELFIADEMFLCGTAAKVTPIKQVENYDLPQEKKITQSIKDKLTAINEYKVPEYQDWITVIDV